MYSCNDEITRAERGLIEGEERFQTQQKLIKKLTRDGYATDLAQSVLELMAMRQVIRLRHLSQWRRRLRILQAQVLN